MHERRRSSGSPHARWAARPVPSRSSRPSWAGCSGGSSATTCVKSSASAGVALERVPGVSAKPPRRPPSVLARARRVGADDQHGLAGGTSAAIVPAMPPPRRSRAHVTGSDALSDQRPVRAATASTHSSLPGSGSPTSVDRAAARRASHGARRSRGSTAPFHSLSSSVNVASNDLVGAVRQPRRAEGDRAGAHAAGLDGEAHVLALPHRARVGQPRGRDEQRDIGVADAERRQQLELLGQRAAELVAGDDGVDALDRHQVGRAEHRLRRAPTNAARNASTSSRRDRAAGRGAVAAVAEQVARRRRRGPPSRSNAGIERPEPVPSSPSSAISTAGRWWRSAIRDATIPMTPGCQPSPAST